MNRHFMTHFIFLLFLIYEHFKTQSLKCLLQFKTPDILKHSNEIDEERLNHINCG